MKISFYKRPKPRQFNYRPLYWDKEKEEAEERKRILSGSRSDDPQERLRSEIRRRWRIDTTPKNKTAGYLKIFFYVLFASFLIYYLFFTDLITKFVSLFLR